MGRKSSVLLVDDVSDDRLIFRRALERCGLSVDLFESADGSDAIEYLHGNDFYADRARFPFPDLVVLDLKMPGVDGFDVLKEIRTKLGFQNLPVVVLTNSNRKADVTASYAARASAFHQKPRSPEGMVSLLQTVIPLWVDASLANTSNG